MVSGLQYNFIAYRILYELNQAPASLTNENTTFQCSTGILRSNKQSFRFDYIFYSFMYSCIHCDPLKLHCGVIFMWCRKNAENAFWYSHVNFAVYLLSVNRKTQYRCLDSEATSEPSVHHRYILDWKHLLCLENGHANGKINATHMSLNTVPALKKQIYI